MDLDPRDLRPAAKPPVVSEDGHFLRWAIAISDLGVVIIVTDADPDTGRIAPFSASLHSQVKP